jgi:hypothetical protein
MSCSLPGDEVVRFALWGFAVSQARTEILQPKSIDERRNHREHFVQTGFLFLQLLTCSTRVYWYTRRGRPVQLQKTIAAFTRSCDFPTPHPRKICRNERRQTVRWDRSNGGARSILVYPSRIRSIVFAPITQQQQQDVGAAGNGSTCSPLSKCRQRQGNAIRRPVVSTGMIARNAFGFGARSVSLHT